MTILTRALSACVVLLTLTGCQTAKNSNSGFSSRIGVAQQRALDSRMFETNNEVAVLNAAVGLLQDLGYKLDETDTKTGLVSGSKGQNRNPWNRGYNIRITVTTVPLTTGGIRVRATFQEVQKGASARYSHGKTISDQAIYRDFFDKLSQSLFLEAHNI